MLEYLKLSCLHAKMRKEFGGITLPHNLQKELLRQLAEDDSDDEKKSKSSKNRELTLGFVLLSLNDDKTKDSLREAKEKRKKIKNEFLVALKLFYKKLLEHSP